MYAHHISAHWNGGTELKPEGFKTKDGHSMAIVVVAESWAGIGQGEHVNGFRDISLMHLVRSVRTIPV